MNSSRCFFKYIYLIFGVMRLLGVAAAFSVVPHRRSSTTVIRPHSIQALHVVADPPMKDDKQKKSGKQNDGDDWILAEKGGFFPNLRSRYGLGIGRMRQKSENRREQKYTSLSTSVPSKIVEVVDIHQYKTEVADVQDQLVCVRFYAPWCKSCKAIEAPFRRMPQLFAGYPVKFVECPVTMRTCTRDWVFPCFLLATYIIRKPVWLRNEGSASTHLKNSKRCFGRTLKESAQLLLMIKGTLFLNRLCSSS